MSIKTTVFVVGVLTALGILYAALNAQPAIKAKETQERLEEVQKALDVLEKRHRDEDEAARWKDIKSSLRVLNKVQPDREFQAAMQLAADIHFLALNGYSLQSIQSNWLTFTNANGRQRLMDIESDATATNIFFRTQFVRHDVLTTNRSEYRFQQ